MKDTKKRDQERIDLILELVDFFNKHDIDYMLGGGTACQLLEDGEIYKPNKEHDIDFHVWMNQRDQILKGQQELIDAGFKLTDQDYKIQLSKTNSILIIEILFLSKEGSTVYFRTTDPANNGKRSCAANYFEKQSMIINDKTVEVVGQKYCEYLY